ncbi:MAG: M1 family aminopeptidase [Ignavibacteria bacterium]|nr:M1 family aminopeptidase [Ignavibacteria bacterium]
MTLLSNIRIFSVFSLIIILFSNGFGQECCKDFSGYNYSILNYEIIKGDSTIKILYYEIDINILLNPNNIIAKTKLLLKRKSINSSFFLNFSNTLIIDSIILNNQPASFSHINNRIIFNYASFDSIFNLSIYYHGLPIPTGFGSFVFSSFDNNPVIWSLSQPYGAQDWFPCKNSIEDKADSSKVIITCSENLIGVSNGVLEKVMNNGNGTKTYFWKSSYPISVYLISIAVSNYFEYKTYYKYSPNDSLLIVHYVYPSQFNSLKGQLDKTINMMDFFSRIYSLYPFVNEKYGHAQVNFSGGMEHQTITSIGSFTDNVIVHELAHMWFGDYITCKDWHHIWLNEGFATYSEALYLEETLGKQGYDEFIRNRMNYAKNAIGSIYVQDISSLYEIFNPYRSYAKGAIVLHMLRGVVGDSVFFRILRYYLNDSLLAYNTATTEDFVEICESVSGLDLNYFFNQWIYGENYPKYTISWSYSHLSQNIYEVDVIISQSVNSNPKFFKMPLEILINTKESDSLFKVFNDTLLEKYTFTIYGEPQKVTVDPYNKILKDKTGDEIFERISYYLGQNYPNPFNSTTKIDIEILEYTEVKLEIYDILGRKIDVLINEKLKPGKYTIGYTPKNLSTGLYFYKLSTQQFTETKKMVFVQ